MKEVNWGFSAVNLAIILVIGLVVGALAFDAKKKAHKINQLEQKIQRLDKRIEALIEKNY